MVRVWTGGLLASVSLIALTQSAGAQEILLDGIVITSSKTEERAIDALSGSSALSKDVIDEQFSSSDVSRFLNTIPGVTTSQTASDTAMSVNIRGLQDFGRVNVLVEGARQNFQRSGHNANGSFYLDPEMIGSVDVTRGPTSTIYGSGAIGGVVSFNLLNADNILREGEYAAVQSKTSYGSNGDERLASFTGAVKSGNFDILGQTNFRDSDDYEDGGGNKVDNSGDDTRSGMINARFRPAAGHQITGTLIDYNSTFVDQLGTTERDSEVDNQQYTLGYTWKSVSSDLIDFSSKIYRNDTTVDQTRLTASFFEPAGSQREFNIETEGFDINNTSRINLSPQVKWALTYGGDGFRDRVSTTDPIGNGDEFTPTGERTVYGAFAQSALTFFDTVDLITALRYDNYELKGGGTTLEGDHVSPKITLGVTPITGLTVFGTWAEGFRAPAVTETLIDGVHPPPASFPLYPNPNLKPEVAQNIEGGVNLKYDGVLRADDRFRAKVVVFQNKVDDYIDGVSFFDPTSPLFFGYQYQNIANATLEGVEIEASYDARSWFLNVSGQHINGTNDDTGEDLVTVLPDRISGTLGFRLFDERLVTGARVTLVDSHDGGETGASSVYLASNSYALVDLFAQYQFNENATLNLNVDNLFDKEYLQYLNQQNSPGLNARVGLTMRFGAQ